MAKIDAFFKLMNEQGASDLHLAAGLAPALRIRGEIERVKYKVLDNDDLRGMLYEIAPEQKIKEFETATAWSPEPRPSRHENRPTTFCRPATSRCGFGLGNRGSFAT